ncbi:MAG: bifunctional hydroxymethylpyrimidine kinase/phosphomethylpyrimidine kinase [Acidilobaceae archaeon]
MARRLWRVAITIAGSDSGGGAGIQADLKTFAALGVHGTTAITSITAQNTYQVTAVQDVPPEIVYEQIKAVAEDMGIDAGKTGMLSNKEIILAVARALSDYPFPLVIDPVMVAKSGARLLREDALEALKRELLPKAKVITPNRWEAEILAGFKIETLEDAKKAAEVIAEGYGCEAVVVKGGHLKIEDSSDILYWQGRHYKIPGPRIEDACTHGTGCSFSAAIAAYLAQGLDVYKAVVEAKKFITVAIDYGVKVGKGFCPVNPTAWLELPAQRYRVLENVEKALRKMFNLREKIMKVASQTEIEVSERISSRYVRGLEDVVTASLDLAKAQEFEITLRSRPRTAEFLIYLASLDPELQATITLRYNEKLIERAIDEGYTVACLELPREASAIEMIKEATKRAGGKVPDVICEGVGSDALIRLTARSSVEAVEKLERILREVANS